MPFGKRRSGSRFGSVALALYIVACFIAIHAAAQTPAQQAEPTAVHSQYLMLDHTPSTSLDPETRALLHGKRHDIVTEAAFFGYNLDAGEWNYDVAACSAMPDQMLLHYRRHYGDGAESLFTAIVPKESGRVWVVPVLYRNATPFRSATGSERSIAVFNRVVPPQLAAKAVQPDGNWLAFALCYADIVYGNANILSRPGTETGLAHAPLPLLRVSEATSARAIVFTDRNAPGAYMVWNLILNDKGQLLAATAQQLADYVAKMRTGAEPTEKPVPPGAEPAVKTLPPPKEPTVKTRPH